MSLLTLNSEVADQGQVKASHEFAIQRLTTQFSESVSSVAECSEKYEEMLKQIKEFNPQFVPISVEAEVPEAKVLAQVVAGIYAPLIHAFSLTILKNIDAGNLSPVIVAPPRDAIPLRNSLFVMAQLKGVSIQVLEPYVNRNTAGIANNQKSGITGRSPYLDQHIDQVAAAMNGTEAITEVETGIYGTTSLVMAHEFAQRGIEVYTPMKIYGLGPNVSFLHGVLSGGQEWIAEEADVDQKVVRDFMVMLDSMEELGMEKAHQSVEELENVNGVIQPVIVPVSGRDLAIYHATNSAIIQTTPQYADMSTHQILQLLHNLPWLIEQSRQGMSFTLQSAIPPMDSMEEHFAKIRQSGLFHYPKLLL